MGRTHELLIQAEARRASQASEPSRLVLHHLRGSMTGATQTFRSPSVMFGRDATNDVAYDPFRDATVSGHHAEIRWQAPHWVLYDMGSLNGTFLNGQPVRRAVLKDEDEVGLGRTGALFSVRIVAGASESVSKTPSWGPASPSFAPRILDDKGLIDDEGDLDLEATGRESPEVAPVVGDPARDRWVVLVGVVATLDLLLHILDLLR